MRRSCTGYANECGEAFRPLVPVEVVYFTYFLAISYVLADTVPTGLGVGVGLALTPPLALARRTKGGRVLLTLPLALARWTRVGRVPQLRVTTRSSARPSVLALTQTLSPTPTLALALTLALARTLSLNPGAVDTFMWQMLASVRLPLGLVGLANPNPNPNPNPRKGLGLANPNPR